MHLTSKTHKISVNLAPHGDFNMYFRRDVVKAFGDKHLNSLKDEKLTDEETKSIYDRTKETKRRASGIKPSKEVRPIKLSNCIGVVL